MERFLERGVGEGRAFYAERFDGVGGLSFERQFREDAPDQAGELIRVPGPLSPLTPADAPAAYL